MGSYYLLIERLEGIWVSEFGSYCKKDVEKERQYKINNGIRSDDLLIIGTSGKQDEIDSRIKSMNEEL